MDIVSALRGAARRLYISLPILLLAVVFGLYKSDTALPTYTLSTPVVVVSGGTVVDTSSAGGSTIAINPFNQSGVAPVALAGVANSPTVRRATAQVGDSASLTASSEQNSAVVTLTAVGSSASGTDKALHDFVKVTSDQFRDLQLRAGAPPTQLLQVQDLNASNYGAPGITYAHRSRTLGAILLGGLVLGLLAANVVDSVLLGRRRDSPAPTGEWDEEGSDPGTSSSRGVGELAQGPVRTSANSAAATVADPTREPVSDRVDSFGEDGRGDQDGNELASPRRIG